MTMSSHKLDQYRRWWAERDTREAAELEQRRHRAIDLARDLAPVLASEYGARKVVLIGSALDPECFNTTSDIDLLVHGMPPENYFAAVARCMNPEFDVDLIPFEQAHPLARRAAEKGMVLHET